MTTSQGSADRLPTPITETTRAPEHRPVVPPVPDARIVAADEALSTAISADLTANPPRVDDALADAARVAPEDIPEAVDPSTPEGFIAGAPIADALPAGASEADIEVIGSRPWEAEGPTSQEPVGIVKLDETIDYPALAEQNADDARALWGNLTPEQIQADPVLKQIADEYGGSVDNFIQSLQDGHKDRGTAENYRNKDIAERLGAIKKNASQAIGVNEADQIIKDARAKKEKGPDRIEFYESSASGILNLKSQLAEAKKSGAPKAEIQQIEYAIKQAGEAHSKLLNADARSLKDKVKEADLHRNTAKATLDEARKNGDPKAIEVAQRKYDALMEHYRISRNKRRRERMDNALILILGVFGKNLYEGSGIGQTIQGQNGQQRH